MTILRVQGNAKGTLVGTTGKVITITMVSTPTSGNVIIITYGSWDYNSSYNPIVSITQDGVTWTGQGNPQVQKKALAGTVGGDSEIWIGIVGAGASKTITITLDHAFPYAWYGGVADACEYSGIATSGYLDKTASNAAVGAGNPTDSGTTETTTQANELWIASVLVNTYGQATPTNSFTLLDGVVLSTIGSEAFLEKIVSATGQANTGTTASTAFWWVGCIATFKGLVLLKSRGSIIPLFESLFLSYFKAKPFNKRLSFLKTRRSQCLKTSG